MMRFRILASFTLLCVCTSALQAATVVYDGSSIVFKEDAGTDAPIEITFRNCMANDLFTFYEVKLDGRVVNTAQYSDNIGPFLVTGKGWIGGNHLSDNGQKTAKTIETSARVDGLAVDSGTYEGQRLDIDVTNELYLPDGSLFAIETVNYTVAGNSIEVKAEHQYKFTGSLTVERYYGMQSMFEGENEILAPGARKYNSWLTFTPGGSANAINIKRFDAMKFSVFVEKSNSGYQAAYMVREGLGDRARVGFEDYVFIGNSYNKSYHKLIGNSKIKSGDTTRWHGVYSWFTEPEGDTFRTGGDSPEFSYKAFMDGQPVVLTVDANGEVALTPLAGVRDAATTCASDSVKYYDLNGCCIESPKAGQVCLRQCGGDVEKILVRDF